MTITRSGTQGSVDLQIGHSSAALFLYYSIVGHHVTQRPFRFTFASLVLVQGQSRGPGKV